MKRAVAVALLLMVSSVSQSGWARRNGIGAPGCEGCHGATGANAMVSASPMSFMPGADVTFSVTISRSAGPPAVGGLFVAKPAVGTLYTINGESLTLIGDGLIHSAPKAARDGVVTFRFGYRAPATPGALNLDVFVLAGNDDGRSSGDVAGNAAFRAVFGCTAREFFYDGDGDGFGRSDFPSVIGCDGQPAANTSAVVGDCDDNDQRVFPGAAEICNGKDDDCDGGTDEGSTPTDLYPDEDGDGFYARSAAGPAVVGCGLPGYAARGGDCAPKDPKIFPGATETCNLLDDNCDGRADERVRPQCGVGFCRRDSSTCDDAGCVPGTPSPETCNLLDDDCDGEVDEGEPCGAGRTCSVGACSTGGSTTGGATSTGATGGTSSGRSGGNDGSGAQGGNGGSGGRNAQGGSNALGGSIATAGNAGNGTPPRSESAASGGCSAARFSADGSGFGAALMTLIALVVARRRRARRGAS